MLNLTQIKSKIQKTIQKAKDGLVLSLKSSPKSDNPTFRQRFFVWRVRSFIKAKVYFSTRKTILDTKLTIRYHKTRHQLSKLSYNIKQFGRKESYIGLIAINRIRSNAVRIVRRISYLNLLGMQEIVSKVVNSYRSIQGLWTKAVSNIKPTQKPAKILVPKVIVPKIPLKAVLWQNLSPIYILIYYVGIRILIANDRFWQTAKLAWVSINYRADVWYVESNIRLTQRFFYGATLMKLAIVEFVQYIKSKLWYAKTSIYRGIYALTQGVDEPGMIKGFYKNIEYYRIKSQSRSLSFKKGARIFGVWWVIALLMVQVSLSGVMFIATQPEKQAIPFVDHPTLGYKGYLYGVSILNSTYTENGTWLNVSSDAVQTSSDGTRCDYQINVYDVKTNVKVESTPIINQSGNQVSTIFVDSGGGVRQFKVSVEPVIVNIVPISESLNAYVGVIINAGSQPPRINGVNKYWIGGNGTWSDTAHWSLASGGAGGAPKPVATDMVIVDTGSDTSSYNFIITLDENTASLLSYTVNNNQCLATLNCNNYSFVTTGVTTLTDGAMYCYNSAISIGSGLTTAFALVIGSDGDFYGGTGAHTIGSIQSDTATGYLILTSGMTTMNGAPSQDGDRISIALIASYFNHGNGIIKFNNVALNTHIDIVGEHLNNVIFNSVNQISIYDSGLYFDGYVNVTGAQTILADYYTYIIGRFYQSAGSWSPRNSGVRIYNGGITITGGTFSVGSLTTTLDCNNTFNMSAGTYSHTINTITYYSGTYFNVTGGTFTCTAGTTTFDGGHNISVKVLAGRGIFYSLTTSGTNTNITQTSELGYANIYTVAGAWNKNGFTLDHSYTIATHTWWTSGSGYGLKDGTSFANRMTIPNDLLNIIGNAGKNLTVILENSTNGHIELGSNYVSSRTLAIYGNFFVVGSDNTIASIGLLKLTIGGNVTYQDNGIKFTGETIIVNGRLGQDLYEKPTTTSATNEIWGTKNNVFINTTFKIIATAGVGWYMGGGYYINCTFYGASSGVTGYSIVPMGELFLDNCKHYNSIYPFYTATTAVGTINIIGTFTGIKPGGLLGTEFGGLYASTQTTLTVNYYKKAYLSTSLGATFLAYLTGENVYNTHASYSGLAYDGLCYPNNIHQNIKGINCLYKSQMWHTTSYTPTYTTYYGNYSFVIDGTNIGYNTTTFSRLMTTDYGSVASPIPITLSKIPTYTNLAYFTTDKINYTESNQLTYYGNYTFDKSATNISFHLKHDTGASFTHKWANQSVSANTTYSLQTIFGASNITFTVASPNGSRQSELIISSGDPNIYPEWSNQTYYTRFYVGATAWINTSFWDNSTFTDRYWYNNSHDWKNETSTIDYPLNTTIRYWTNYTLTANTTIYHAWVNNTQNINNYTYYQNYTYVNTTFDQVILKVIIINVVWTNETIDQHNHTQTYRQSDTLNTTWLEISDIIFTVTWYNITQILNQTVWNGTAFIYNQTYIYTNLSYQVQTHLPMTNWATYITLLGVSVLIVIGIGVVVLRWFKKVTE